MWYSISVTAVDGVSSQLIQACAATGWGAVEGMHQLSAQISDASCSSTAVMSPCFLRPWTIRRTSPFQPWPRMIFPAIASSM